MKYTWHKSDIAELVAECDRLRALNTELLEALEDMVLVWELLEIRKNPAWDHKVDSGSALDKARTAIARAKGEL